MYAYSSGGKGVFVWELAESRRITVLDSSTLANPVSAPIYPRWAPDSRNLLFSYELNIGGGQLARHIAAWDGTQLREILTPLGSESIQDISGDGRWVSIGGSRVIDLRDGSVRTVQTSSRRAACANSCLFVGTSTQIELETYDTNDLDLRTPLESVLWDVATDETIVVGSRAEVGRFDPLNTFNERHSGRFVELRSPTGCRVFDVTRRLLSPSGPSTSCGFPMVELPDDVAVYYAPGSLDPTRATRWLPFSNSQQVFGIEGSFREITRQALLTSIGSDASAISVADLLDPTLSSRTYQLGFRSWSSYADFDYEVSPNGRRLVFPRLFDNNLSQRAVVLDLDERAVKEVDDCVGPYPFGSGAQWSGDSRVRSYSWSGGIVRYDFNSETCDRVPVTSPVASSQMSPSGNAITFTYGAPGASELWLWVGESPQPEPSPGDRNGDGQVRIAVLGDSYISGEGSHDPPYDLCTDAGTPCNYDNHVGPDSWFIDTNTNGTWDPGERVKLSRNNCHRSPNAWPRVLADRLGSEDEDLLFVPCSGAVAANVTLQGQVAGDDQIRSGDLGGLPAAIYNGSPPGIAGGEPQLQALRDWDEAAPGAADAVFVSLGGNDFGFADIIKKCALPVVGCSASFRADVLNRIEDSTSDLAFTFEAVRNTVEGAPVYAFTYPMVVPPQGDRCGAVGGLDWIRSTVLPAINGAVVTAARSAGIRSVDISGMNLGDFALPNVFAGHEICSSAPWVNELTNIQQESYHPTAAGHAAITAAVQDYLVETDVLNTVSNPVPTGEVGPTAPTLYSAARFWGVRVDPYSGRVDSQNWLTASVMAPADSVLSLVLRSEPRVLATTTVDSDGIWDISMPLPSDLPSGTHTLSVEDNLGNVLASTPLTIESPPSSSGSEQMVSVNVVGSRSWQGATSLSEPAFEVVVSPDGGLESLEGSADVTTSSGERLTVAATVRRLLWWSFGSITVTNLATARTVQGVSIFAPATDLIRTTAAGTTATVEFFGLSFYRWQPVQNRLTLIVESTTGIAAALVDGG